MIINISTDGVMQEDKTVPDGIYCHKQCAPARKLINCHGYNIKKIAYKQTEKNVLGSLPVIQYVNMSDMVDARRTLACLCLFNGQGADILKAYMKAIIKCFCREWPDKKNVKVISDVANQLFRQIQILYQEDTYKETVQKLEQNFEQYSNAYCKYSMHNLAETIRESDYFLQKKEEHYTELQTALAWILSDEPDIWEGLYYLYYIVEKILVASESDMGKDMHCFFENNSSKELEHDTYKCVDECVERLLASGNIAERKEICLKIEELLDNEL